MAATPLSGPGVVRVPSPAISPGVVLDARGNPFRAPADPLAGGDTPEARVRAIHRDIPITISIADWSVTEIRDALEAHTIGMFQASGLLIDAIEGDDRVQAAMHARTNALLGLPLIHEAADTSTEAGECRDAWTAAWARLAPQGTLAAVKRGAIAGGISISEILWDTSVTPWQPILKPWHLSNFYFDWTSRELIAVTQDGPVPVVPGDGRWFVHAPHGLYRGWMQGAVRALALPWLLRNLAARDWARYSERHGLPLLKAKTPAVAHAESKDRFVTSLQTMGTEAVVELPQGVDGVGFDLELLEATANTWQGFMALIARCDTAITLTIQHQNLTTEVKEGSLAAARVHGDVRQGTIEFDDASLASDVHEQIARPFAAWNFGRAELAPRTRHETELAEDRESALRALLAFAQAVAALVSAGVRFEVSALAKGYGVRSLERAELVAAAVKAGAAPAAAAEGALKA